jgi:HSP20 family protein
MTSVGKEEGMKFPYTTERLFEDLFDFRRDFDEMFNRILTNGEWNLLPEFKEEFKPFFKGELKPELKKEYKKVWNFVPAIEAYIDKEARKYVCRIALPGIEPKDVIVNVEGNMLKIRGERKLVHRPKETELFEEEIAYGVFERVLTLPEFVNVEKLVAEYVNGVLEIVAPVAVAALPRKIEIKTAVPLVKQIAA